MGRYPGDPKHEEAEMKRKVAVVITSINDTTDFVKKYAANAEMHDEDVEFIVVEDTKSPHMESNPLVRYLSPTLQNFWLSKSYPDMYHHLPWNTIARSNVGRLLAYDMGYDVIIMLDDDNLATADNFVKHHSVVGTTGDIIAVESTSGWYNVAQALVEENGVEFYPRGYPPEQRWNDGRMTYDTALLKTVVNAGLWINDPDIDAITRLERELKTTGMKDRRPDRLALLPGTWSPWNSQNTAIAREALVAYWMSPYAGRHMDIWASYVANAAIEHMGDAVSFGRPLVNHDRVEHDLYKDLEQELPWIKKTDMFVDMLRNIQPFIKGSTYVETMRSIVDLLRGPWIVLYFPPEYYKGLDIWVKIFEAKEK
jgi:hypothetical protein